MNNLAINKKRPDKQIDLSNTVLYYLQCRVIDAQKYIFSSGILQDTSVWDMIMEPSRDTEKIPLPVVTHGRLFQLFSLHQLNNLGFLFSSGAVHSNLLAACTTVSEGTLQ